MGGPVRLDLSSHARDDHQFNCKKRDLKTKYLTLLQNHLKQMKLNCQTSEASFLILSDFERHLTAPNSALSRVPIHVLTRGEKVFRAEVLKEKDSGDNLIQIVWKTQGFRNGVIKKFEEVISEYGNPLNKSPKDMESFIFIRAKKKEEYLDNAARIIIYIKQQNSQNDPKDLQHDMREDLQIESKATNIQILENELSVEL